MHITIAHPIFLREVEYTAVTCVSTVSADNILHEMSKLAVDTLDSNPYMKYADKIRLLEKLEREASALADVRAADL